MRRFAIVLLAFALAACRDREEAPGAQRTGGGADSAGIVQPPEPRVTPAESARAARAVQRHVDSMRAAVLRESGLPPDEPRRRRAPRVDNSPRARYESCMAQAQQSDEPVRSRLVAACENIRRQPEYPK